jgi:hypothetical protein
MIPTTSSRPIRFVFYRPYTEIWFKDPVRHLMRGESLPHKYEAFFDSLLISGAKVSVSTALCRRKGWKGLIRYLLDPLALIYWVLANKISLSTIGLVFSKSGLRKHDVLFFMHYGNFTYEDAANAQRGSDLALALSDVDILKLGHFTHYAYQPVIGSNNLKNLGVNLLVAENNLISNSDFYRKYFGHLNTDFWCLPFIAANRFKSYTPFRERSSKLVATGSITFKMTDPDFINFFKTDELQPLRRQIYEHADNYKAEIDSLISDLNASRGSGKIKEVPFWRRVFRRFVPHPQHSYYQKNIVDVYNSYMMFTVPEEICDLPAIGVVEGMACGCAFIGLDSPMYRDLGMVPGVHYVAHNGTLEDLIDKIRFYQQPTQLIQLEQIAETGCKLVTEKFRAEVVYREFVDRLSDRVLGCESIGINR